MIVLVGNAQESEHRLKDCSAFIDSDKPRYDQIVSKIISLAQIGGKTAVDDPHHYSPGTIEYGKVVLNLACLTAILLEMWEAQRSWSGGEKSKDRKPDDAESAAGPFGA